MSRTVEVDPGILADIKQCFVEVAQYMAMCAEVEQSGGDYCDADEVHRYAGERAIAILERLFPDLAPRQTDPYNPEEGWKK